MHLAENSKVKLLSVKTLYNEISKVAPQFTQVTAPLSLEDYELQILIFTMILVETFNDNLCFNLEVN